MSAALQASHDKRTVKERRHDLRLFSLFALAAALAVAAASAQAGPVEQARFAEKVSQVRTLVRIPGRAGAFAQDGDRVAWVCGAGIELLNVQTGRRSEVVSRAPGPCDASSAGPIDLALAGARVLVFTATWSNASGHFAAYSGSSRTDGLRAVAGGRSDLPRSDVGADPRMLIAGSESTLALTSGCESCGSAIDAKIVVGLRAVTVAQVASVTAFAVGGGRLGMVSGPESSTMYSLIAWLPGGSLVASKTAYRAGDEQTTRVSVAADGHEFPLTEPTSDGVPSPDGRKIAVVRTLPQDGGGQLYRLSVREVQTGSEQQLGAGYGPAWSPDSRLLMYSRPGEKEGETASVEIFDGVSSHSITQGGGASWSPDGKRIAYLRDLHDLHTCDPDGGADRRLLQTNGNEIWEVRWSPNGRTLVFSTNSGIGGYEPMDIWRIGSDGSGRRRLTHDGFVSANPVWSPDGKRIAFTSDRNLPGRITEIFTMDEHGRNQRRLSRTDEPAATITIADIATRRLHRTATSGTRFEIGLSARYAVILGRTLGRRSFVSISEASTGQASRRVDVPGGAESLSISGRTIIFRVRRTVYLLDAGAPNPKPMRVAIAASTPIGLSIEGSRIVWLESSARGSRVRALTLER